MKAFFVSLMLLWATSCAGQNVAYEVMSPVVQVLDTEGRPLGSATSISERQLVTNAHVVGKSPAVRLRVFVWDTLCERIVGSVQIKARVLRKSEEMDLALLEIEKGSLPWARLGTEKGIRIFDDVIAVGAGAGMDVQPYMGEVIDQDFDYPNGVPSLQNLIQISSEIVHGCSGGGVFIKQEGEWRLLGIVCAGFTGSEMSYIIPVSRIVKFLDKGVGD